MIITVLVSVTGRMVIAVIYNYLLSLFMPYSFCPKQTLQLVVLLYLVG